MDYENMSDFEINKRVAEIKYPEAEDIPTQDEAWVDNDTECQVIIEVGRHGFKFDQCNNPSDAWKIIVENKISLCLHSDDKKEWFAFNGFFSLNDMAYSYEHKSENPLRAAMIVYLMMQGG